MSKPSKRSSDSKATPSPPPRRLPPPPPPPELLETFKDYWQAHVFSRWDTLSAEGRDRLVKDLESIRLPRIDRIVRRAFESKELPAANIKPVPESYVATVEGRTKEDMERWRKMGMTEIYQWKVAVLVFAGGQGTRLGSSDSKGCFNIGLPSGKSLFQLQAERILRLQVLAAESRNKRSSNIVRIHWYIMTGPLTDEPTRKYFQQHKYFGLQADQITFFQQGTMPFVSKDGNLILEKPYRVAKSLDGNGGVFSALKIGNLLEDMSLRGIKYIHCYGVENALVRVADPTFLGYFIDKGVATAAKVVCKASPQEKVGVFVRHGKSGPLSVVEYSELEQSLSGARNEETGHLRFCWSNVSPLFHLAEKQIPSVLEEEGRIMAYRLERFIYDSFLYAPSAALFEVLRDDEFAPVTYANGSDSDTPAHARMLVLRLHSRWVVAAGGSLTETSYWKTDVEVSPLRSYAGENLEAVCRGKIFRGRSNISSNVFCIRNCV